MGKSFQQWLHVLIFNRIRLIQKEITLGVSVNKNVLAEVHFCRKLVPSPIDDMDFSDENSEKSLGSQVDLTLLLEELRQLRQQLVKTIENNDVLRQKLEEQLKQARPPTQIYHHYHNGPPDGEDSHSG